MNHWNAKNVHLTSQISRELAKVTAPDSSVRQTALSFFKLLYEHKATFLLFSGLNQITNMRPCWGISKRVSQFRGCSPTGQTVAAIVLSPASREQVVRRYVSNTLAPITTGIPPATMPSDLMSRLLAKTTTDAERADLTHTALCFAAKDQMEVVSNLVAEGARNRTLVIHLLWIDGTSHHLFNSLAIIDAPAQVDMSLLLSAAR